ncbi:MAG: hypothetical protein AAF330_08280, partial [Pseudomonadota bacterium]
MDDRSNVREALGAVALIAAAAWLLLSDYHPMSLAGLTSFYFLGYIAIRLMKFMDQNRFTPKRT